jgi:hypothetical protein
MHCDYLNKFIWGGQDSKREEKNDENLDSNPIKVQTHSLVSVFFLCNIGKTETFMLFWIHDDYLNYIIWEKWVLGEQTWREKWWEFKQQSCRRSRARSCQCFFAMQHGKTETSYAIYAIVIIALCWLFLLDLSFRKKNMLKKLTRSQATTMSRSVDKKFGMC